MCVEKILEVGLFNSKQQVFSYGSIIYYIYEYLMFSIKNEKQIENAGFQKHKNQILKVPRPSPNALWEETLGATTFSIMTFSITIN